MLSPKTNKLVEQDNLQARTVQRMMTFKPAILVMTELQIAVALFIVVFVLAGFHSSNLNGDIVHRSRSPRR